MSSIQLVISNNTKSDTYKQSEGIQTNIRNFVRVTGNSEHSCTTNPIVKPLHKKKQIESKEYKPLYINVKCKTLQDVRILLKSNSMTKYLVPPVVKAMLEEDLLELQKLAKSNADFSVGIGEITPLKIAIELDDWDFFYLLMLKDVVPKNKEELSDLLVDKYRFSRIPYRLENGFEFFMKTRFEFYMKVSEKYSLGSGEYYRVKNGCVGRKVAHDNRTFWYYDEFLYLVEDLGYFENKLKRLPSLLEVKQPNRRFRERTHLKTAILREDVKAVKFLLHQPQINVNFTGHFTDYFCKSPLHLAVQTGNLEIVNLLLSHKDIDVNALDYEMKTPLIACLESEDKPRKPIKLIGNSKLGS